MGELTLAEYDLLKRAVNNHIRLLEVSAFDNDGDNPKEAQSCRDRAATLQFVLEKLRPSNAPVPGQ